jgi:aspartyl-tRNA(Asn)/glutamyl-tRNA(Gln) amidotransferase subunit C
MKITDQDVRYVADLANLELSETERAKMAPELTAILDYIDQLSSVDTEGLEPMAQVSLIEPLSASENSLRADELRECLSRENALSNAPQTDGSFFRVPKVIER